MFTKLEIMGREGGAERQTEHETASERDSALGRDSQSVRTGAERPTHTQWVKERERRKDRQRQTKTERNRE